MQPTQNGIIRSNEPMLAVMHRWLDLVVIAGVLFVVLWFQETTLHRDHWISLLITLFLFYLINDFSRLYGSWRGEHSLRELRQVGGNWAAAFAAAFVTDYFFFQNTRLPDMEKDKGHWGGQVLGLARSGRQDIQWTVKRISPRYTAVP